MQHEGFQACARCGREAPPPEAPERGEWEAIDSRATCPGCITLLEEEQIVGETQETAGRIDQLSNEELLDELLTGLPRATRLLRTADPALLDAEQLAEYRRILEELGAVIREELRRRGFEHGEED
jgi:hypothetical protein